MDNKRVCSLVVFIFSPNLQVAGLILALELIFCFSYFFIPWTRISYFFLSPKLGAFLTVSYSLFFLLFFIPYTCVCVWCECVGCMRPVVPDQKKKSKLQNQRFHTFYVSTSLIPFHDKLLSQTILCCVKPPLAGTKSCNKDTEVWQDMWEKASNSYRGCLINILDYKISSFFLVCVCLSVFIAD